MDHADIARLINREGESVAVEALIDTYETLVYRLALSILDDPAEAQEATQDAFIAAIDRLHTYRGEASLKTWLYAIALNVCRGRLRKRRARQRLLQALRSLSRSSQEAGPHPEQTLIRREADAALWRAIHALSDKHRETVILRYYQELRLADIANVLGVSERTVRARLHAAHEHIRNILEGKTQRK